MQNLQDTAASGNGVSSQLASRLERAEPLLRVLVPRAEQFGFFNPARDQLWSSEATDDAEVANFVECIAADRLSQLMHSDQPLQHTLRSGRTLLAMAVRLANGDSGGMLTVLFSRNTGQSSSFEPARIAELLAPALTLVGDTSNSNSTERDRELQFIYELDEKIHGVSGRHSSLAQLVGRSGKFLGINYSVLLIPQKRIRISATHSSWKSVDRKMLDRYLIDYLLPKLDGKRWPVIFRIPSTGTGDGDANGYQALLCPILDRQGNVEGVLAQLGRVDGSEFAKDDQRFMAHIARKVEYVIEESFDAMTGLMNRGGFEVQLRESRQTLKGKADSHQVVYFDLDSLQLVNDTFGRKAGDAVITRFAKLLDEDLPSSGVLSRLTGDDFCLLLTHADTEEALEFANRIRGKLGALRYLEGDKSLQVTISVGITQFDRGSADLGAVMTTARMACEAAKAHGRDRVEVFDEGNRSAVRRFDDMQLVASVQQALDGGEFQLVAQPIADLKEDGAPRFEVLLRMDDGDGGSVPTGSVFSAAERYNLMPQIDRWVVSNTLAALHANSAKVQQSGAVFCINLSGQSLSDDEISEFIVEELAAADVPPEQIGFEITESAAVSHLQKAQDLIDTLRQNGCPISLDDFGAGLSSFAYLKNFQVDTLKIDGSFIRDIAENRISEAMVAAISEVARVMRLKTVAEYVETEAICAKVKSLDVSYAQGHLFGRPEPLDDVIESLGFKVESYA